MSAQTAKDQLANEPAEVSGRRAFVPKVGKLVPDERMIDVDYLAHATYVV